jgi:hypothetical protein
VARGGHVCSVLSSVTWVGKAGCGDVCSSTAPGALSVNSVLGKTIGVAGDNSLDWMTPVGLGARSAQC